MIMIKNNIAYLKTNREDANDHNTALNERVYARIKNASAKVKLKYNAVKGIVEVSGDPENLEFKIQVQNRDQKMEQEILDEFMHGIE